VGITWLSLKAALILIKQLLEMPWLSLGYHFMKELPILPKIYTWLLRGIN